MKLSGQWMCACPKQRLCRADRQAIEHPLSLSADQLNGIEVTVEELQEAKVWCERVISLLLRPQHQVLVRGL